MLFHKLLKNWDRPEMTIQIKLYEILHKRSTYITDSIYYFDQFHLTSFPKERNDRCCLMDRLRNFLDQERKFLM